MVKYFPNMVKSTLGWLVGLFVCLFSPEWSNKSRQAKHFIDVDKVFYDL